MIDAAAVAKVMDDSVAALMITNPNTLGLFETNIEAIAEVVHAKGGMVYLDGANLNALMGIAKPGHHGRRCAAHELAQDLFDAPRRWRPGAGPVAVKRALQRLSAAAAHRQAGERFRARGECVPNRLAACARFSETSAFCVRAYATFFRSAATGSRMRAGWRC